MTKKLILLEYNEINFEYLERYISRGHLPNFRKVIESFGYSRTSSESQYEHLEPWIQWVTAHTGLSLSEHGIFRLGDITESDLPQIWEVLEEQGLVVGAVSPMNAKNRLKHPAFFIPDPWTETSVSAGWLVKHLYEAIVQAVSDNVRSRLTLKSAFWLAVGLLANARARNYRQYLQLALSVYKHSWQKAMILDLLLADIFIDHVHRLRPDFASIFLNAGAHIQHHYMFSSSAYEGPEKNPEWYVEPDADPLLDVYRLYDRILGDIRECFSADRIMIATGLHQDPHTNITYYWRLKKHEEFLRKIGVPFAKVRPRMSRDFLIACKNSDDSKAAADILRSAVNDSGIPLFSVDNRGTELFVELVFPREISRNFEFTVAGRRIADFADDVAFVAVKNGQHHGTGYFVDTGVPNGQLPPVIALKQMPTLVCEALGVEWQSNPNHGQSGVGR